MSSQCVSQFLFVTVSSGDLATQFFADRNIFCAGRVEDADLQRAAKATGGKIQSTVHGLTPDVLGNPLPHYCLFISFFSLYPLLAVSLSVLPITFTSAPRLSVRCPSQCPPRVSFGQPYCSRCISYVHVSP